MRRVLMMGDAGLITTIENLAADRADDEMLDRAPRVGVFAEIFNCGLVHAGAGSMRRRGPGEPRGACSTAICGAGYGPGGSKRSPGLSRSIGWKPIG